MKRNISFFILLMLFFLPAVNAQDNSALTEREKRVRDLTGMNSSDYAAFANRIRQFNKQEQAVAKNSALTNENRRAALFKIQGERKAYVKQHLGEEQLKNLKDLDKDNPAAANSPYKKRKKELDEKKKANKKSN